MLTIKSNASEGLLVTTGPLPAMLAGRIEDNVTLGVAMVTMSMLSLQRGVRPYALTSLDPVVITYFL